MPFMPAEHPLPKQMIKEHEYIRELILGIDQEADREDFIRLTNLLEAHIRFEERELFQYLEQQLSPDQLLVIFEKLEKHPVSFDEEWKDHFWTREK